MTRIVPLLITILLLITNCVRQNTYLPPVSPQEELIALTGNWEKEINLKQQKLDPEKYHCSGLIVDDTSVKERFYDIVFKYYRKMDAFQSFFSKHALISDTLGILYSKNFYEYTKFYRSFKFNTCRYRGTGDDRFDYDDLRNESLRMLFDTYSDTFQMYHLKSNYWHNELLNYYDE
jgi:hypothetical protein